jgi:hypothetical protein
MKLIFKHYGLPKSGTNVLHYLLNLNFTNYVASIAEHNVHYLGWKHGKPLNLDVVKKVEVATKEKILFIFIVREYKDWLTSIKTKHLGTWEFTLKFFNSSEQFVYNTPTGPEFFESPLDLYNSYVDSYKDFCNKLPDQSMLIAFEDLKTKQKEIIISIQKKFNLNLVYSEPIEIKKHIDPSGQILDFIL